MDLHKEYGGYIELDRYFGTMMHENAILLNCGRNCLAYLLELYKIKKIAIPFFMCDSVIDICKKYDVKVTFYHIDKTFIPTDITLADDEWLYVMNYYGQISNETILEIKEKYVRIIVDNAQAYYCAPCKGVATLYTCRKFFGVPDGAILYDNRKLDIAFPVDESFDRMNYLLGRFERPASEFYEQYVNNNDRFTDEPIKYMSKLTNNLLHAIDYEYVRKKREENFIFLANHLGRINLLDINVTQGPFAYPLLVARGYEIRKELQKKRIYIPLLWPNVIEDVPKDSLEYRFAKDILPLPIDQRYNIEDMKYIVREVLKCIS